MLVHGLGGNRWVMRSLERRLQAHGYRTLNWQYLSTFGSIDKHAQQLARRVEQWEQEEPTGTLHFVTHSLGSILTRVVLEQRRPANLGRVVMLAPPNRGSPVATFFQSSLGRMIPAISQLSDHPDSFVNTLPRSLAQVEIGVLAAESDILVPAASTQLEQLGDHRTLACRHLSIVFHRQVPALVDCFLREGNFGPVE